MQIREEASKILGIRIEKGHWDDAFDRLDVVGRLTTKMMFQLILTILKKLDEKDSI